MLEFLWRGPGKSEQPDGDATGEISPAGAQGKGDDAEPAQTAASGVTQDLKEGVFKGAGPQEFNRPVENEQAQVEASAVASDIKAKVSEVDESEAGTNAASAPPSWRAPLPE